MFIKGYYAIKAVLGQNTGCPEESHAPLIEILV